ncbi:MAG: PLP-dependent transferase [Puniceicoccales bacterium]|jgi:cystathionine gamma-synthase|nr:PLP-dependent transferase [Puniceicoccales bacterium]
MPSFQHFPLGTRIPDSPHAVVVSLPTIADVIGYEERHVETMDVVRMGYPRFIRHPYLTQAARKLSAGTPIGTRAQFPVASASAARRVIELLGLQPGPAAGILETDGWALLHLDPADASLAQRAAKIIQHTGIGISSREAEDWLVRHGHLRHAFPEKNLPGDATATVLHALSPWLAPAAPGSILLCRSGMNAFFAAFEASHALQRRAGRTLWLQLGWLYADTTEIFLKCLPPDESLRTITNVFDKEAILRFFAENGHRTAAVITEAPNNPLIQTPDLPWLASLARQHGALCLFDPSTCGLANTDLLPHADVLVASLTKYCAHEGDVMAGVLAVNPASPWHDALRDGARAAHSPPYWRDSARLAAEIATMPETVARINANTLHLAAWLEGHPSVRRVCWTREASSRDNYAAICRTPESVGGLITIELDMPLARFYDRLKTAKGPSFGTDYTLASPYIYMAHYDCVIDAAKRRKLQACGIDPELVRISVGTEPWEEIEATLAHALDKA